MNRTVVVLASLATLIALLFVIGFVGFFLLWTRKIPQHQVQTLPPPPVVAETPATVVTNVVPAEPAVTNAAPPIVTNAVPPLATNNVSEVVTNRISETVTNAVSAKSQVLATRIASAAWSAWVKAEADRLQRTELAEARLKEARASATPQDAHAALCDAAEAGHAEAQYLLARVYDFWGWGGWVRTKEERSRHWTDWLRRIDFEKGAKAVLVSRPAPNAEEFRKLAQDWYRSAAENGVVAAEESLAKHEALAARKAEAAK